LDTSFDIPNLNLKPNLPTKKTWDGGNAAGINLGGFVLSETNTNNPAASFATFRSPTGFSSWCGYLKNIKQRRQKLYTEKKMQSDKQGNSVLKIAKHNRTKNGLGLASILLFNLDYPRFLGKPPSCKIIH